MQTHNLKNNDDLIQGIRIILSNYRCSFSDEEQVLLNDCINALEKSKSETDPVVTFQESVKVVGTIIRVFSIIDHFKDLF